MAINQAQLETSIKQRSYDSPQQNASLKALLTGIQGGVEGANKKSELDQSAKLKEDAQGKELDRIKGLGLKAGDSAKVGDTMISKNGEGRLENQRTSGEAKAIKSMHDTYNHGLGKMQDQAQALAELTDSLKNPNQMSLGAARSLLLKSFGMNRYNGDEAKAVLPGTLQGTFARVFSGAGGDDSTLTPAQIKDIMQAKDSGVAGIRQRHDTLKQNALQQYMSSPYGDTNKARLFGDSLGSPFAAQLEGLSKAQAPMPATNQITQPAGQGGIVDKLTSWLKGSAQQQAPAGGGVPSFEEFKKMKAEGKL